jgi:hypothetical protein
VSARLSRRATAVAALFALVAASCVPASDPAEPAGAIGFVTEPTAASLGQPFHTADGWTVRIELLALQVNVNASSSESRIGRGGSGDFAEYRIASNLRAEIFARGLAVGPATVNVSLSGSYVGDGYDSEDRAENIGLPPEIVARFGRPADAELASPYPVYSGPSLVLVARGEKSGRVVVVDFTLGAASYDERATAAGEVRPDALTVASLSVVGEALFRDEAEGPLVFDEFASADADGNGLVTGAEIVATARLSLGGIRAGEVAGLLEKLHERAVRLLAVR